MFPGAHDARSSVRVDGAGMVQLPPDRALLAASRRIAAPALAIAAALSQTLGCATPTAEHVPATPTQIASTAPTPSSVPQPVPCERPPLVVAPPTPPDEPKRVVVTSDGAPMPPPTIRFASNTSAVRTEDHEILAAIVETMRDHPEIKLVDVVGHTDTTEDYGPQLAMQRANAVIAALVELGVAADRLRAVSAASSLPVAPNDTPDGRAANRRVSFAVSTR